MFKKKFFTGGKHKITRYMQYRKNSPYIRINDGADGGGGGFTTYRNRKTGWIKTHFYN